MVCTKINIFLYIVAFWQHLVVQGRFGNSASPGGGGGVGLRIYEAGTDARRLA